MPSTKTKIRLTQVLRSAGNLISVEEAAESLDIERTDAAKILARWHAQGWVKRIRRGLYAPVPLHAMGQEQVLEDPWVVAPEIYGRCYIGGWSAAEHWGLTEQMFRVICVFTTKPVRKKSQTIQGISFLVKHIRDKAYFGTKTLWRGKTKIQISDPHRTILDMLDDPTFGGGIEHASDCLKSYVSSIEAQPNKLLEYADRLGNGAVFKRLGFLSEHFRLNKRIEEICATRLTKGNAKLDPALPCDKLITKWRLWVPESWKNR